LGGPDDALHLNETLIFFVHVPKTGGQTLSAYLRDCFFPRPIINRTRLRAKAGAPLPRRVSLRHQMAREQHRNNITMMRGGKSHDKMMSGVSFY
jgi:hypothetical protein